MLKKNTVMKLLHRYVSDLVNILKKMWKGKIWGPSTTEISNARKELSHQKKLMMICSAYRNTRHRNAKHRNTIHRNTLKRNMRQKICNKEMPPSKVNSAFTQVFRTNHAQKLPEIHVHVNFTQSRWMPDWSFTQQRNFFIQIPVFTP